MYSGQAGKFIGSALSLWIGFALVALTGCGHSDDMPKDFPALSITQKSKFCVPAEASSGFPERQFLGQRFAGSVTFAELRDTINSSCKDCHQAPAASSGITYIDAHSAEERTIGGVTKIYPGISEVAEDFAHAIATPDNGTFKQMPPESRRKNNPAGFLRVGKMIEAWIAAGKPNGNFSMPGSEGSSTPAAPAPYVDTTEVGDCIPLPEAVGFDFRRDKMFEDLKELPKNLMETDMFSLDAFELAQKGTVAYNVEYPLWADNNEKGRWVHVPMKIEGNKLLRQSIQFDARAQKFDIPENTRFYKSFYKLVKQADGKTRARRVETRIIVVRYPSERALFGTYRWDDSEQVATLIDTPYRDGTPFRDTAFSIVVDEKKGRERKYAIPGKHRCLECHMGSETKSFVLGFSPLQINRRAPGEYARNQKVTADELSLADRLSAYGVVKGYVRGEELPRLETIGQEPFRNIINRGLVALFSPSFIHGLFKHRRFNVTN